MFNEYVFAHFLKTGPLKKMLAHCRHVVRATAVWISKLSLEQEHLNNLRGSQLMLFADMLKNIQPTSRWRTNLMTQSCMHSLWTIPTQDASTILCELLRSIRGKCEELSSKCQEQAQHAIKPHRTCRATTSPTSTSPAR